MKKVYIAGFDVFCKNSIEIGNYYKKICNDYGIQGLYPLDNECEGALEIFKGNIKYIDECDVIIANLNNFRGDDMDSGTAFELGYGFAKNKELIGYLFDNRTLIEKLNGHIDKNGYLIEDFKLPVNLMIGKSTKIIVGTFEDAIQYYYKKS